MIKRRGRSGARYAPEWRGHTGTTARAWLFMRTEEASQVLEFLGPDQRLIELAACAFRAVVLELGLGAEPGACGLADGVSLVEGLFATALPRDPPGGSNS